MDAPLEFRVLGPVEATANSIPLGLGGPKQRALLALLLLRANEVVPRDRIIDELWGDAPPPTARDTVNVYVGRLRKTLGQNGTQQPLLTRGGGYELQIQPEQLDLLRFEGLAASGSRALAHGDARAAATALDEALSLWRGTPLVDLGEVPFARDEQARLEELRLSAVEERIDAQLALGRASTVLPDLQELTREHPYRERLHRQLMLAYYRVGRQAEALEAYQSARRSLVEELGIEPSPALKELERAILGQDPALEGPAEPSPQALETGGRARRRRREVVSGVAALVAVTAVVAAFISMNTDAAVKVRPNSIAVIDPGSNELVDDISVGREPAFVAAAGKHVWVGNRRDRNLIRIDPDAQTPGPAVNIPLDGPPAALIAGPDAAWVITAGSRLKLARFDPRFEDPVAERGIAADFSTSKAGAAYWAGSFDRAPLALGNSTIWTLDGLDGSLTRLDRRTLTTVHRVPLPDFATAIAADGDAVWVTTKSSGLLRVDPDTNSVVKPIPTPAVPVDVTVGARAVWIVSEGDDVVVRLDPTTGSERPISVGARPTAIAYGFGSVWVACKGDGTVWRIEPATNKVIGRWKLGASPDDIAAGAGAVWTAVYSGLAP